MYVYIYIYLPIFIFTQEGDAHDDHGQAALFHLGQAAPALTVRMTNGFARSMWGLVGTARLRPPWPPSDGQLGWCCHW